MCLIFISCQLNDLREVEGVPTITYKGKKIKELVIAMDNGKGACMSLKMERRII